MRHGYEWKLRDNYIPELNRRRAIAHCIAQLATCGFALWAIFANQIELALLGVALSMAALLLLPRRVDSEPPTRIQPRWSTLGTILFYSVAFGILTVFHPDKRIVAIVALVPWLAFIATILAISVLKARPRL